jgi:hypothetical protein
MKSGLVRLNSYESMVISKLEVKALLLVILQHTWLIPEATNATFL